MRVVILALFACTVAETTNPVQRVVELVQNLKTKIKEDAKKEQVVYDKYACWCEKTTERTTAAIAEAKALIEDRSTYILEAKGRLGSAGAEIANFKKQIAENLEAQGAAESLRKKENTDYLKTKGALEQGISNLDKAITVLGAATSSKGASHLTGSHPELGVMETNAVVETRMLTVAAGVRSAMRLYAKHNNDDMNLRSEDFAVVKNFLSSPGAYVQMGSPHKGEYQSQSQGIQGILKDMHDSFQRDLADAIEEEKAKQADYDSLMKTKREDEVLLKSTLTKKDTSEGDDTKGLADANTEREETQAQLKSDEELLETTTTSCKAKANEWAERSRLRSEELAGINEAIDILTSPDAVATFATADSTFVQTRSVKTDSSQTKAYNILKDTASKTQNVRLAMLASKVYAGEGSHFDKVIEDIEKMISKLRDEEQSDIDHKDWCESERNKANTANEDLEYAKDSLDKGMKRSGAKIAELNKEHAATKKDMSDLKKEMEDALDVRNAENAAFKDSIKADTDAVTLLTKAIGALSKFYEKNALLQKQDPEYTTDENKPPEAEFTSATSSGSTNTGIVSTLGGIKEDLVNEMKVARTEEAEADAAYRKLLKESQDAMDAMDRKCVDLKASIAEQNKLISDLQETYDDKQAQKDATDDYLDDLKENCDWIMNEFENRKKQRKDELAGLDDAKSALAGMKSALVTKKSVVTKGQTRSQSRVADALADLDNSEKQLGMSFLQRSRR
jgi:hypothetical protein